MIIEYQRPQTLAEALAFLARPDPHSIPMGGGSALQRYSSQSFAVVDLQDLPLNHIQVRGNFLDLGATTTLQALLDSLSSPDLTISGFASSLKKAILHETTTNLRQVATVAGALVAADGRSDFATALLALDAQVTIQPGESHPVSLGNLLPLRSQQLPGRLITQVTIPTNVSLAYEYVARTPADLPLVCVAVCAWPSGRTRVAVGGFGAYPLMAFDGPEASGAPLAAHNACSQADDAWASAAYRQDVVATLTTRCLTQLGLSIS